MYLESEAGADFFQAQGVESCRVPVTGQVITKSETPPRVTIYVEIIVLLL